MKTKTELKSYSGALFKRVMSDSVKCIEDIDAMREKLFEQLDSLGIDRAEMTEDSKGWRLGRKFVRKPKIKREQIVTVTFRSNDYLTEDSEGNITQGSKIKDIILNDKGFSIDGGKIKYFLK